MIRTTAESAGRFESLKLGAVNSLRRSIYGTYGLPAEVTPSRRLKHFFVLGHMRAGSSLLMKLISTSPEVLESGELMLNYQSRWDLATMKGRLLRHHHKVLPAKEHTVALDKLLHNYQLPIEKLHLVSDHDIKLIFLVRSPKKTIDSIVTNFANYSVQDAVEYYIERVEMLAEYAQLLGTSTGSIGMDYEHMIDRPQPLFRLIEEHLGLRTQLQEEYEVSLGRYGRSDPSDNIKSGRILAKTDTFARQVEIPIELLEQAERAYQRCRTSIFDNCRTIES